MINSAIEKERNQSNQDMIGKKAQCKYSNSKSKTTGRSLKFRPENRHSREIYPMIKTPPRKAQIFTIF